MNMDGDIKITPFNLKEEQVRVYSLYLSRIKDDYFIDEKKRYVLKGFKDFISKLNIDFKLCSDRDIIFLGQSSMGIKNDLQKKEKRKFCVRKKHLEKSKTYKE